MPTVTNADALLIAANDLQTALKGGIPQVLQITAAVRQLMQIFKANAEAAKGKEQESGSQRAQRECALRDHMGIERAHVEADGSQEIYCRLCDLWRVLGTGENEKKAVQKEAQRLITMPRLLRKAKVASQGRRQSESDATRL